jgi:hypothetical protein
MAPSTRWLIPWPLESFTITEEVERVDERVTLSAVLARSRGLVRIKFAWTERELKQSLGYIVDLQDVLMNSVLVGFAIATKLELI